MHRLLILLLLATAAQLSSAAPPHPSLPSAVIPEGLGVNIHFTDPRPGEMEMLADAGFRWVRMDFSWEATERERGKYDFSAYDRLMAALEKQKIRALFILDYGNGLYEPNGALATEAGRRAFARWAAAAAVHFKGRGILWEIWNEPNGSFWKPQANVAEYVALALATSKAIRTAAPGEAIIGPATSGIDQKFIEACFRAGLLEWWDAVSVHPYRQAAPETVSAEYHKLRQLIAAHAPPDKTIPILSGEWGYSAAWDHFDPVLQGEFLSRQWLMNLADHIPLSIWYDWHDDGSDPKEPEHHFGTVAFEPRTAPASSYEPKPAYLAAKTLSSVLNGYQFQKRIALASPDDYALLFDKPGESRLAVWTTSAEPHEVKIPASPGTFKCLAHTGEDRAPVSASDKVLTMTLSDAPQFLIIDQPNQALHAAPEAHPMRATLAPARKNLFAVQVENLASSPFKGTVTLTSSVGDKSTPQHHELVFEVGESEKAVDFTLAADATEETRIALSIEKDGYIILAQPARTFHWLPEQILTSCNIVPDGDAKVHSTQSLSVGPAPLPLFKRTVTGWQMSFTCAAGWKFFRVTPPAGAARTIAGKPKAFGFWITGDAQNISPRLRVVDATGQTWQPSADVIDLKGWRYVELELSPATGHWGGSNDGKIHYPIAWDSLFLLDNVGRTTNAGTIYVTAPVVIY